MLLLLDMNLSPRTVVALREAGWDAIRSSEVLAHDAPDSVILAWAREHGRVVVTHDSDFSALLAASGASAPSVIRLRVTDVAPLAVA